MSLDLSFPEVEELLERVIHNRYISKVGEPPNESFMILSSPNSGHLLQSRFIRSQALLEAEKQGLPSVEDTLEMAEISGLVTDEDNSKIEEISGKITSQMRVLQMTKIEGRRKPIEELIAKYEAEIGEIEAKRDRYYVLSREYKADEESVLYLAWAGSKNIEDVHHWESFKDFEDEKDLMFRNSVVDAYAQFNRGLALDKVRYLARHTMWRIRYTAALKMGGSLFPGGLTELTPDQQSLLYWSNYYQSIYDMPSDDRPDDDVINDDKELDTHMESFFKQQEQDRSHSRLKSKSGSGKLTASEKDEIIITGAHPQYMSTDYSEDRIKSSEGESDVEVVSPMSKRAINRRESRKNR